MYKLEYIISGKVQETYYLDSLPLARWKKNQLANDGNHKLGEFVITRV